MVPQGSSLQSLSGMKLIDLEDRAKTLYALKLNFMAIPSLSETDKKLARNLDEIS